MHASHKDVNLDDSHTPDSTPNRRNKHNHQKGGFNDHQHVKKKLKKRIYKEISFKGLGIMKFDDFNYKSLNNMVFNLPHNKDLEEPLPGSLLAVER